MGSSVRRGSRTSWASPAPPALTTASARPAPRQSSASGLSRCALPGRQGLPSDDGTLRMPLPRLPGVTGAHQRAVDVSHPHPRPADKPRSPPQLLPPQLLKPRLGGAGWTTAPWAGSLGRRRAGGDATGFRSGRYAGIHDPNRRSRRGRRSTSRPLPWAIAPGCQTWVPAAPGGHPTDRLQSDPLMPSPARAVCLQPTVPEGPRPGGDLTQLPAGAAATDAQLQARAGRKAIVGMGKAM